MKVIFCVASTLMYKGIEFERQRTGCPFWPLRPSTGYPYLRLSKRLKGLLDELLAARKAGTLDELLKAQEAADAHT